MKWPQHRDVPDLHRATAPYNFVPLPEQIFEVPKPFAAHDRLDKDRLHGEIHLHITTETATYTRCAYPPAADPDDHGNARDQLFRQEFFHYGDPRRPVLPGATLRGAIRNLVEILGSGRISRRESPNNGVRVRDERLVHRAVADQQTPVGERYTRRFLLKLGNSHFQYPGPNVKAGYLESGALGTWQIRPAVEHHGQSFVRVPASLVPPGLLDITRADQRASAKPIDVWVQPSPLQDYQPRGRNGQPGGLTLRYARSTTCVRQHQPGLVQAQLVPTGRPIRRSLHTAVYAVDTTALPLPISEDIWRQWEEDRDLQRGLPNRLLRPGEPVFYLLEGGKLCFFGPCLFFRVPFQRWTLDYVPAATLGKGDAPLDLAEVIFGTVNAGERKEPMSSNGAHRGRVIVEDAQCLEADPFLPGQDGRRWPGVLSAPKPTSYQLYLVQPNDLGRDDRSRKNNLLAYDAPPPDGPGTPATALRGFKRYWHRGPVPDLARSAQVEDGGDNQSGPGLYRDAPTRHISQFTRIRPVRAGAHFEGRIRFENLENLELGALLAALELPASCRHQVGMGKPLGLGALRIEAKVRLYNPKARYCSLQGAGWYPDTNTLLVNAREAFRAAMVAHHNQSVLSPKLPLDSDFWQIPRLSALKHLLEWDTRPSRLSTRPQNLATFKERRVLPSPATVRGLPTTPVDAEISGSPTPPPPVATQAVPNHSPQPLGETRLTMGHITNLEPAAVVVTPDGGLPLRLQQDIRIFPMELWKKFNRNFFSKGRVVKIEFRGTDVVRVEPVG